MGITRVKNYNIAPYYDDFDETKNYHRIQFRPGHAVQARELTQLQTAFQSQLDKLGQYNFKDGSRVIGGKVTINTEYDFIKLTNASFTHSSTTYGTTYQSANLSSLIGSTITGTSNSGNQITALVLNAITATGSEPNTLYIRYINAGGSDKTVEKFVADEVFVNDAGTALYGKVGASSVNPIGQGAVANIEEGAYFIAGTFVYVASQSLILDKYTNTPNYIIGLNVAETFDFSALRGYRTGGTIHIIVNNQIGFTTSPAYSRSSPYPTDVAKMVMAPIFHVNGDDPEAVVHAARIAVEFKQQFHADVIIDMFCYRRFGHNEGDEPSFTQPLMYKKIKEHPTTREIYAQQLVSEGVFTADQANNIVEEHLKFLDEEFEAGTTFKQNKADWLEGKWTGLNKAHGDDWRGETSSALEDLKKIGDVMTTIPANMQVNGKLQRVVDNRKKAIESGEGLDWATAEHLAFGTLLLEGYAVRLSGQDSGRGTFSQRHSVFVDQNSEERFIPLANINDEQARFV